MQWIVHWIFALKAAALAEAQIGAAMGMQDVAYIMIGTGIGAGGAEC